MMFNARTVLLSRQYGSVYKIGKLVTQQHTCSYSGCNISSVHCLLDFKTNFSSYSTRFHSYSCKHFNNFLPTSHTKVLVADHIQFVQTRAAGHSKWQNIKSTKEANDLQRARIFSLIAMKIKQALKDGSSNPVSNPQLAAALEEAKRANMPKSSTNSIIEKSQKTMLNAKEHFLEYRGMGGLVLFINVSTDNLNRAKAYINIVVKKYNFKIDRGNGSIRHMFDERGIIVAQAKIGEKEVTFSEAEEHAIESGAEEVELHQGVLQFTCGSSDFHSVRKALEQLGYTIDASEVEFLPKTSITLDDPGMEAVANMMAKLEDIDDVVRVYINAA